MKLELIFKTPDVVDMAIDNMYGEPLEEEQVSEIKQKLSKWIKYGEILKLEYDSETNEITVCPA